MSGRHWSSTANASTNRAECLHQHFVHHVHHLFYNYKARLARKYVEAFGGNLVYTKSDLPQVLFQSEQLKVDFENDAKLLVSFLRESGLIEKPRSTFMKIVEAWSQIGGFCVFMHFILGFAASL